MKHIELSEQEKKLLMEIMNFCGKNGENIQGIRLSIKIIDKIEKSSGFDLEDAEIQYILHRFEQVTFVVADRNIISLFDKLGSGSSP